MESKQRKKQQATQGSCENTLYSKIIVNDIDFSIVTGSIPTKAPVAQLWSVCVFPTGRPSSHRLEWDLPAFRPCPVQVHGIASICSKRPCYNQIPVTL